jgi:hypothetical protein
VNGTTGSTTSPAPGSGTTSNTPGTTTPGTTPPQK